MNSIDTETVGSLSRRSWNRFARAAQAFNCFQGLGLGFLQTGPIRWNLAKAELLDSNTLPLLE